MIRILFCYLIVNSLLLNNGCAGEGDTLEGSTKPMPTDSSTSDDADPEKDEFPLINTTATILNASDANDPGGKLCYDRSDFFSLPILSSVVAIDGDLQEWQDEHFVLDDPGGDSNDFDIHKMAAALVKTPISESFVLAVKGYDFSAWATKQTVIALEFGSLIKDENSGETSFSVLRKYQYGTITGLQKRVGDRWQSMPSSQYQIAITETGQMELALAKSELDEVLLQPLWSVQLEVRNGVNGDLEQTGRYFYKNILSYPTGFKTHRCALRIGSQDITIQEIIDDALFEEANDDVDDTFDSDHRLQRINTLLATTRAGIENAWIRLGKPVTQVSHYPMVFAKGAVQVPAAGERASELLAISISDSTRTNPYFSRKVYELAGDYLIREQVYYYAPYAKPYLLQLVADMLSEHVHKKRLGIKYWLESYQGKTNQFSAMDDREKPVGLLEWSQKQDSGTLSDEAQQYFDAKVNSLALILNRIVPANVLLAAVASLKKDVSNLGQAVSYERLFDKVDELLNGSFREQFAPYVPGWFHSAAYLQGFSPFLLSDEDLDGLPRFFEVSVGINPGREDSDADGWTDLAEIYAYSDPRSASSKPNGIMADGSFGDWQELIPDQVRSDNGANSAGCPAAADISHYAGLFDHGKIIIAAAAKDLWSQPPYVRWEVQLSIKNGIEEKIFTLRTVKNRYYYDVLEGPERKVVARYPSAKPLGIDSMEWFLDLSAVGVDMSILGESNYTLTYRISTLFEDQQQLLCDDTSWTQPLFSTTSE